MLMSLYFLSMFCAMYDLIFITKPYYVNSNHNPNPNLRIMLFSLRRIRTINILTPSYLLQNKIIDCPCPKVIFNHTISVTNQLVAKFDMSTYPK